MKQTSRFNGVKLHKNRARHGHGEAMNSFIIKERELNLDDQRPRTISHDGQLPQA